MYAASLQQSREITLNHCNQSSDQNCEKVQFNFTGWPKACKVTSQFHRYSHEVVHVIGPAVPAAAHVLAVGVELECGLVWLPLLCLGSTRLVLFELC